MVEEQIFSNNRITLSKTIRDALGVGPGDRIQMDVVDGSKIVLTPVKRKRRLSKSAVQSLKRAEQDVAKGRVRKLR